MGAPLCITDLQFHREDVLLESRDCGQKLPAKVIALIDNNKKTPWLPESFHFEKKINHPTFALLPWEEQVASLGLAISAWDSALEVFLGTGPFASLPAL